MSTNVPIASITLSAATPSVTFSGIPQTYTDLFVSMSLPAVSNGAPNNSDGLRFRLNGDAGSNYSSVYLTNNSSSATSSRETSADRGRCGNVTQTSNDIGTVIVNFNNYTNTEINKTVLGRSGNLNTNNDANIVLAASLWRSTSAITSITFSFSSNGNFASGSTFNLYGINAANSAQAKATGGDTIIRDASYWYHVFNRSSTFTPSQSLTADVLVVAGGGGSSQHQSGGGGAGGLLAYTSQNLSATNYTITVGAGGAGVLSGAPGGNGSNSQFASTTACIGGGGGGTSGGNGQNGGSGGGGGGRNTGDSGINAGGLGTAGQGNNGGTGTGSDSGDKQGWRGGGGGGAGAVGGNGLHASQMAGFDSGIIGSGNGGAGTNAYSSWASVTKTGVSGYFAGGGAGGGNSGGGTGGLGGGGNGGGTSTSGTSGISNTGGGAGGAGNGTVIANGGSGIIIVRYPV